MLDQPPPPHHRPRGNLPASLPANPRIAASPNVQAKRRCSYHLGFLARLVRTRPDNIGNHQRGPRSAIERKHKGGRNRLWGGGWVHVASVDGCVHRVIRAVYEAADERRNW